MRLAWRIFFPEEDGPAKPKEQAKKRLRMVLVADRCGMNPSSLSEMKKHVVKALQVWKGGPGGGGYARKARKQHAQKLPRAPRSPSICSH